MEHIAIMKKSWGLTEKILTGEKKIESRWYKSKHAPWDKIKANEAVYFKNSGKPVIIKARVDKVIQFSDLNHSKVKEILCEYGQADGLGIGNVTEFFNMFKDKKYCILIFLKEPQKIEPCEINKSGFGSMSAWISVNNIDKVKLKKAKYGYH